MSYTRFLTDKDSEHIRTYKLRQYSLMPDNIKNETLLPKNSHLDCMNLGSVGNIAFAVNQLYFFKGECENIYMDFNWRAQKWGEVNPYDKIFEQKLTEDYVKMRCWGAVLFDYDSIALEDIRKNVQPFFKFHKDLIKTVNDISIQKNINEKTLGVNIRLYDFNHCHGSVYGYAYYDDYIKEIDALLNNNDINNIFVGSDNYETLEKLKSRYDNKLIFAENVSRNINEGEKDYGLIMKNFHNRFLGEYNFITPFIDFLLMIKCGYFIGRKYSNFSSAIIYLGNMKFENIIELPKNTNYFGPRYTAFENKR